MQYMLLIYRDETAMGHASPAQMSEVMGAFMAYTTALRDAGAFVAGDRLDVASTATTVRIADGKTQVLDGPYASEVRASLAAAVANQVEAKTRETKREHH